MCYFWKRAQTLKARPPLVSLLPLVAQGAPPPFAAPFSDYRFSFSNGVRLDQNESRPRLFFPHARQIATMCSRGMNNYMMLNGAFSLFL